jgi:hypothetical protein
LNTDKRFRKTNTFFLTGSYFSNLLSWQSKATPILAWESGVTRLTRIYLNKTGHYEEFLNYLENEYRPVFGNETLPGENLTLRLPTRSVPNSGVEFTSCQRTIIPPTKSLFYCGFFWLSVGC